MADRELDPDRGADADKGAPSTEAAPPSPMILMDARSVRRLEWASRILAVVALACAAGLAITLPRHLAYTELVEENLALKAELTEVDSKLAELDRIVLRLRLYDAEIRSLAEPTGDHGPLPMELPPTGFSNGRLATDEGAGDLLAGDGLASGAALGEVPMDEDVRPAAEWAASVSARLDTLVGRLATAEPDLSQIVGELEELRALERALPGMWPADGDFTSGFGWRRSPFTRRWKFHSGIDIAGRRGTPIYAPADGRVIYAGYNSGYGRMIEIDHGFGITTRYAHNTSLRVREGDAVRRGDLIATMGSTGHATGPHLHFEVRLEGHAVEWKNICILPWRIIKLI